MMSGHWYEGISNNIKNIFSIKSNNEIDKNNVANNGKTLQEKVNFYSSIYNSQKDSSLNKKDYTFLNYGASPYYNDLINIIHDTNKCRKWIKSNADSMSFGFGNAIYWLKLNSLFIHKLTDNEMSVYRKYCTTAYITSETQMPLMFLLYRDWGLNDLRKYLDDLPSTSAWNYLNEEWSSGIDAMSKINLNDFSLLDERSKFLLLLAANKGGKIASKDIPKENLESKNFFTVPSLSECVEYKLHDTKVTDLALFLKSIGKKQAGIKEDKIKRIMESLSIQEIANKMNIDETSYLQLFSNKTDREIFCKATAFLNNVNYEIYSLDFKYFYNISLINEARENGFGIRLLHNKKCPVHRKNVYRHSELNKLIPIAHPDCDAAFLSDIK